MYCVVVYPEHNLLIDTFVRNLTESGETDPKPADCKTIVKCKWLAPVQSDWQACRLVPSRTGAAAAAPAAAGRAGWSGARPGLRPRAPACDRYLATSPLDRSRTQHITRLPLVLHVTSTIRLFNCAGFNEFSFNHSGWRK